MEVQRDHDTSLALMYKQLQIFWHTKIIPQLLIKAVSIKKGRDSVTQIGT